MRYIFTLAIICLSSLASFAQIDFDDLFKSMKNNDRFSNMLNLRHYQMEKPERAVPYFLLGGLLEQYLHEADPLKYFFNLEIDYQQAKTCYGLAKGKLDEKQARQDREYFGDIRILDGEKKVDREDIVSEIDKRLKSIEEYYQNASKVNDSYIRFINQYNECLFGFRNILGYYPYFKDLCLLANPAQIKSIEKIGANFEESLSNFKSYSEACKKVAYFSKIPVLKLKPIVTYRLEGLVESNYSAPMVELWDYKSWADDFVNVMNSDIKTIREELIETDTKLDAQIKDLQEHEFYNDEFTVFKPDEHFKFLIGKYDYNSICNKLLNYKEAKIDFLKFSRRKINDPLDTTETYLINRLTFYKELATDLNELNDEASALQKSVTIENMEKYFNFFETRYQGMDRFSRWCNVELYNNTNTFNKNLKNLDSFLKRENEKYNYSGRDAVFQNRKLALGIQHPDTSAWKPDNLITQKFLPSGKTTYCLSGYEIKKDSLFNPFVAQVDSSRKVRWFDTPGFKTEKNVKASFVVSEMKLLDDSTLILLFSKQRSKTTNSSFQNYVTKYNWKGKELSRTLIDTLGIPKFFYYDEISDEYFLVTQRANSKDNNDRMVQLNCHLVSGNGEEKWSRQFSMNGSFVDVILTNSNFFVFVNASRFTNGAAFNLDGKGETSALGIFLNHDGSVKGYHQFGTKGGLNLSSAIKINSNNLNLIGKCNPEAKDVNGCVYLLITPEGAISFKNKEEIWAKKTEAD